MKPRMMTTVIALTIAVAFPAEADGDADRRRRPDAGGGGQAVHLAALRLLDHRAGAEEADPGDQALDAPGSAPSLDMPACCGTSTNRALPRATSMWVRRPAALSRCSRS